MQSLSRSLVGILQAAHRASPGPARSLIAGLSLNAPSSQNFALETAAAPSPSLDLYSRWARGCGASCSFSSRRDDTRDIWPHISPDEERDLEELEAEREGRARRAGSDGEGSDGEGSDGEGIDGEELELLQHEAEAEKELHEQAPSVVRLRPVAPTPPASTVQRWLPAREDVRNTKEKRMQAFNDQREPDEKEDEILDPLELVIWLKEHFMKQELPLSDSLKELIFRNHWDKVLVDVRRTVKVTKSAKLETYHAVACVGNYEGLFGVGIASSNNAQVVVGEAYMKAYQNLVPVPLYRGHTIYHKIEHKFHTIKMILMPRPAGYGLVCNPMLRQLCVMIGIKDISIKVMGRRNRRNKFEVVKCLLEALQKQSTPHDGIEGTGVYAREIYYRRQLGRGLPCNLEEVGVPLLINGGKEAVVVPHGGRSQYSLE